MNASESSDLRKVRARARAAAAGFAAVLEGSWVVVSGVMSRVSMLITGDNLI